MRVVVLNSADQTIQERRFPNREEFSRFVEDMKGFDEILGSNAFPISIDLDDVKLVQSSIKLKIQCRDPRHCDANAGTWKFVGHDQIAGHGILVLSGEQHGVLDTSCPLSLELLATILHVIGPNAADWANPNIVEN